MKKILTCLLTLLVAHAHGDIRGSRPLPESAVDLYPYNTVGIVSNDNGWAGTGTAIGNRTVITAAHVYYDDELKKWNDEPYTWSWKRTPENAGEEGKIARSTVYFEDYAAVVDASDRGSADLEAFNKDIYILQFLEDITTSTPAKWATDVVTNPSYKMIVGYPRGYYDFWQRELDQMHATYRAEPIQAAFQSIFQDEELTNEDTAITRRLYFTTSLRSTSGNSGGPLFNFEEQTWTMSGVYVGGAGSNGAGIVVGIDQEVADLIQQALQSEEVTEWPTAPIYDPNIHDLNSSPSKLSPTPEDVIEIASIFPSQDEDFYQFETGDGLQRRLYVFAGDVAVHCQLVKKSDQTVEVGSETTIPVGNIAYYNIGLFNEDYMLQVRAADSISTGHYSYGIVDYTADTVDHIDHGQIAQTQVYDLGLNDELTASVTHFLPNDFFSIQVEQPGRLILQSDGPLNGFGLLGKLSPTAIPPYTLNDLTEIIDYNADSSKDFDFQIEADVQAGDYVLIIESQFPLEKGFYSLKSKFIPKIIGSPGDDVDFNDSFKIADHSRMLPYEEKIEPSGDVDIRGFMVYNRGTVSIQIDSTLNLAFEIYTSDFNALPLEIGTEFVRTETGYNITKELPEGYYYIKTLVPGAIQTGDYTISFQQEVATEGFWVDFEGAVDGTKNLEWFGLFISEGAGIGWIRHQQHEYLYVKGNDLSDFWMWDPELSIWFRTSKDKYPILEHPVLGREFEYVLGTKSPRLFKYTDENGEEVQIDENQLKELKPLS